MIAKVKLLNIKDEEGRCSYFHWLESGGFASEIRYYALWVADVRGSGVKPVMYEHYLVFSEDDLRRVLRESSPTISLNKHTGLAMQHYDVRGNWR